MEREDFGRCAAWDSAVNSRVLYMKEEHRGEHLTTAMRCLLFVCVEETGNERQRGMRRKETEEM